MFVSTRFQMLHYFIKAAFFQVLTGEISVYINIIVSIV
jgi:hypothetical protein